MKRILALLTVCIIVLGSGALLPAQADTTPHTNWYEIFVRSFADSDGDGLGDLNGVREKLPYLTDLGFTGIWLMPIMPSPSYHKYDVTDYQAIDPEYGTLDDFRALIETAHEIGIRVILDLPVNHTSVLHPWFQAAVEALREGRSDDPYIEYYHFSRERSSAFVLLEGTDWYYEEQFSGGGMPDLNLDNPAVRHEIKDILSFWLNEIVQLLNERRIGLFDTATAIRRLRNTASDKDLEVVQPTDLSALLRLVPHCRAVCTTGQKATDLFCAHFDTLPPPVGQSVGFTFEGRSLRHYRMPSSSRAYPMKVEQKAEAYCRMFCETGIL